MADTPPRLIALDALRGAAVMGILLMNITSFAMPAAAYLNPAAYGGTAPADLIAWALCFVLVDGKMRALFSFLFGASMVLIVDRAEAAGDDGAIVHFRRMAALLAIGLCHAYLIWSGDILVLYAAAGSIAFAFSGWSVRRLVVGSIALLIAQMLLLSQFLGALADMRDAALAPGAPRAAVLAWRELADQVGAPSPAAIAETLAIHHGSYATILAHRLEEGAATPFLQFLEAGAETVGLMLLGMAALRCGFLTGAWQRVTYARIAIACYLVGLPAVMLIAAGTWRSGFDEVATVRASELLAAPFRPILMIGHAALLLWWLGDAPPRAVARLAAVGRAALTNYIGTSIAMTTLFYGYGGGLFGHLRRTELYLVVPIAWLVMLLWSKPWLDRYRYGPVEWLWRSLSRGELQPMRRMQDIAS